jgi:hypothetical protein
MNARAVLADDSGLSDKCGSLQEVLVIDSLFGADRLHKLILHTKSAYTVGEWLDAVRR